MIKNSMEHREFLAAQEFLKTHPTSLNLDELRDFPLDDFKSNEKRFALVDLHLVLPIAFEQNENAYLGNLFDPGLIPDAPKLVSAGHSLFQTSEILRLDSRLRFSAAQDLRTDIINSGGTLHIQNIQHLNPIISDIASMVSHLVGNWPVRVNQYLARPGSPPASSPHFDPSRSLILQLQGTKKWVLWKKRQSSGWEASSQEHEFKFQSEQPKHSIEMTPGDMMILPSGVPHVAFPIQASQGDFVSHLTFMIFEPSQEEVDVEVFLLEREIKSKHKVSLPAQNVLESLALERIRSRYWNAQGVSLNDSQLRVIVFDDNLLAQCEFCLAKVPWSLFGTRLQVRGTVIQLDLEVLRLLNLEQFDSPTRLSGQRIDLGAIPIRVIRALIEIGFVEIRKNLGE